MARAEPRSAFERARSAHSPGQRRVGEGNPSDAGDVAVERKVRITVDLPKSLHKALRIRAIEDDTDGQTVMRRALEQYLGR